MDVLEKKLFAFACTGTTAPSRCGSGYLPKQSTRNVVLARSGKPRNQEHAASRGCATTRRLPKDEALYIGMCAMVHSTARVMRVYAMSSNRTLANNLEWDRERGWDYSAWWKFVVGLCWWIKFNTTYRTLRSYFIDGMVKPHAYNAENLGSNPAPGKLTSIMVHRLE